MATLQEVTQRFSNAQEVAKFLADPKGYATAQGLNADDPQVAGTLELYAKTLGSNVNAANDLVGLAPITVQWGIGASCCNKLSMTKQ
jgi:hypothetical protein